MNGSPVVEAQLGALRAHLVALIALLDVILQEPAAPPQQTCQHPETENIGTMGHPARRCRQCGARLESVPVTTA